MRVAKALSLFGILAMAAVLIFAFRQGNFRTEGQTLLSLPWGIVSLVDLYVGFALFSAWIIYREASPWLALLWVLLVITLGFLAASLYAFLALQQSQGSWQHFFQGKHARGFSTEMPHACKQPLDQ